MREQITGNFNTENRERLQNKPYVVSADIKILLESWANINGFILPSSDFFNQLRVEFTTTMQQMFPRFELIEEEEITNGIRDLVKANDIVPVSLDRVYYRSRPGLDIARLVDDEGNNKGLGKRADAALLLTQFRELRNQGLAKIALVDDVIFTGDILERVIGLLERTGIEVPLIYAGIGIDEGVNKLSKNDRQVFCVKQYPEVIDQVCERDFYPGVPFSGRLINNGTNVGMSYILPFGNPGKWASIPSEWELQFSRFCLNQTIRLFREIESASAKEVKCLNIDRKPFSLPQDQTRFISALETSLMRLKNATIEI